MRVVITGGCRGLGAHLALWHARRGDQVLVGFRGDGPGPLLAEAVAAGRLWPVPLDVTDAGSVRRCVERSAGFGDVDVLVNNAGVYNADGTPFRLGQPNQPLDEVRADDAMRVLAVNAVGPLLVAAAWRTRLIGTGRSTGPLLVNVSSRFGSLAERDCGGDYYYAPSKAALNMVTRCLAADLAPAVTVVSVHPGWVRTGVGGTAAPLAPDVAAAALGRLLDRLGPPDSGRFLDVDGATIAW